jgi:ribosomal protein S3
MRLERGEMILLTSHNSLSNVVEALEANGMEVVVVSGSLKGLRRGRKAKSKGDGGIGGMR